MSAYEKSLRKHVLSSSPGKDLCLINPFTGKKEDPKRGCEDALFTFDFNSVRINQVESCAVEKSVQDSKPSRNQSLIQNQRKNCNPSVSRF